MNKDLKIVVINISLRPGSKVKYFPVGLGFVMTAIKNAGYQFDYIDQDLYDLTQDEVLDRICNSGPYDVCLMGCIVTGYKYVKSLIEKIKTIYPQTIIGVGNSVATSIPNELLTFTRADVAIIGEGDITDVELLNAISQGGRSYLGMVDGIAYKNDSDDIIFTKPRPVIEDISNLNIDYDLFEIDKYLPFMARGISRPHPVDNLRPFVINTARGCINRCTFCYHVFRNDRYRRRSMEMIMRDCKHVIEMYDVNYIEFADDLTFFSKDVLEEFLHWKKEFNIDFCWEGIIRGNLFNREDDIDLLERLKKSGCWLLKYSLESSNPEILKAMKKHVDLNAFKMQTRLIKSAGINVATSLVIGYPQETPETIRDTFNVCAECGINPSAGYLLPQPGTEVYDYAINEGYITDIEEYLLMLGDRQDLRLNMTKMTDEELVSVTEESIRQCNKALGVVNITGNLLKTESYFLTEKGKRQN